MRGSPLLRALLAFVVILLAGYPLWRLTDASPAAAPAAQLEPAADARPLALELTFTRPPASVKILHLGQEVWKADAPEPAMEAELSLPFPPQGIELVFSVAWPEGDPAALRVRVQDPAGQAHERTLWGRGATTEVLSFP